MRAGVVQFRPEFGDVEGNLEKLLSMVAAEDADLFVLPELALSGYLFESRDEALSLSQDPLGDDFRDVAALARRQERDDRARIRGEGGGQALQLIDPDPSGR